MTEDEMVGWHHQIKEHEFEQALGDGDGQGSLECCSQWGRKELEMTERLNNKIYEFNVMFPSKSCFHRILQISINCIFIFVKTFKNFS